MNNDIFLRGTKTAVLADLKAAGFLFGDYDEDGMITERAPKPYDTSTLDDGSFAVYLGKVPISDAEYDEDGELITPAVMSTTFHANIRYYGDHTFTTAMATPPGNPHNRIA